MYGERDVIDSVEVHVKVPDSVLAPFIKARRKAIEAIGDYSLKTFQDMRDDMNFQA